MNGFGEKSRGQIIEVWAHNLEDEIARIREVVERYQYIALDTEFPGIVARPTSNASDYNYRTVKYNVDLLKVIQLGITFADEKGCLAEGTCTWQFNFRFDLNNDMYAQNSIDFLKENGIDFDKQQKIGVDVNDFGELIMNSGLLMNNDIRWIAFHGCYDFGYLLKLLTCDLLPDSEIEFFNLLQDFFPSLYDIKYLLLSVPVFANNQIFSLQKLSEHLKVTRIGAQHQAGSDSLVTCKTFFRLIETYFNSHLDQSRYSGIIFGLGITTASPAMLRTNSGNNASNPNSSSDNVVSGSLPTSSDLQNANSFSDNMYPTTGNSPVSQVLVNQSPSQNHGMPQRSGSSGTHWVNNPPKSNSGTGSPLPTNSESENQSGVITQASVEVQTSSSVKMCLTKDTNSASSLSTMLLGRGKINTIMPTVTNKQGQVEPLVNCNKNVQQIQTANAAAGVTDSDACVAISASSSETLGWVKSQKHSTAFSLGSNINT